MLPVFYCRCDYVVKYCVRNISFITPQLFRNYIPVKLELDSNKLFFPCADLKYAKIKQYYMRLVQLRRTANIRVFVHRFNIAEETAFVHVTNAMVQHVVQFYGRYMAVCGHNGKPLNCINYRFIYMDIQRAFYIVYGGIDPKGFYNVRSCYGVSFQDKIPVTCKLAAKMVLFKQEACKVFVVCRILFCLHRQCGFQPLQRCFQQPVISAPAVFFGDVKLHSCFIGEVLFRRQEFFTE